MWNKIFCQSDVTVIQFGNKSRRENIRITTIYPGAIKTELLNIVAENEHKRQVEGFYEQFGLQPETIANAILYAISQPDGVDVSDLVVRPTFEG